MRGPSADLETPFYLYYEPLRLHAENPSGSLACFWGSPFPPHPRAACTWAYTRATCETTFSQVLAENGSNHGIPGIPIGEYGVGHDEANLSLRCNGILATVCTQPDRGRTTRHQDMLTGAK